MLNIDFNISLLLKNELIEKNGLNESDRLYELKLYKDKSNQHTERLLKRKLYVLPAFTG
ncbi:hypothetical protein A3Q56_08439 [Intoshia linei]|uniref:Uncharacterized protein n=1 Tax=Intoshia linei TaxID=1819745 RepID=A0A177APV2_9BILA|nr:hypothetical protein A3Q56_08439 [Intoshia linei]